MAPPSGAKTKLNTCAHERTFPYPTKSKSFLQAYSNDIWTKSLAQTMSFNSMTDRQRDRQTDKKLNVFASPGGARSPSPTKLGMVIEDLEHVLASPNIFRSEVQYCRYRTLKIWGKPDTLNSKLP